MDTPSEEVVEEMGAAVNYAFNRHSDTSEEVVPRTVMRHEDYLVIVEYLDQTVEIDLSSDEASYEVRSEKETEYFADKTAAAERAIDLLV